MKVINEISAMQNIAEYYRRIGMKIGFVPTMGFLHEGHLSLLINAKEECDIVITSIFVNPTQFLPNEDFNDYPRDFLRDFHLCKSSGCDYLFYPDAKDVFPENYKTFANVNDISDKFEGKFRSGHFKGVATVVLKLVNITKPHNIYFGQKDAQQVAVLRKMFEDLNFDVNMRVCDSIREESGLAMSSRNIYLNDEEKKQAPEIYSLLNEAKKMILENEHEDIDKIKKSLKKTFETKSPKSSLQYIAITDNKYLEEIEDLNNFRGEVLVSLAVIFGKTRLIDNILFTK